MTARTMFLVAVYGLAIVGSSLLGGWLPSAVRLTHLRTQVMLSFVGGLMLGVGLLHMLPHSFVELGSLDSSLFWTLIGLLGMFLLIRTFHFHQHGPAVPEDEPHSTACDHGHGHVRAARPDTAEERAAPSHESPATAVLPHSLSWTGVTLGLSLHTFLDGIALGAAVVSDAEHRSESWLLGVGVFAAILLHKPLDALSITSLMQASGWTRRAQQLINAGFAMMCPLGAATFLLGLRFVGSDQHHLVGIALAISAGVFLCISLSDLLPELQFHHHDGLKLSLALILGVLCAYGLRFVEPDHAHDPAHPASEHRHASAPASGSPNMIDPPSRFG